MKPRLAVLVGATFVILALALYGVPRALGGHVDFAGVTMLLFLSVGMALLFYVLAASSPRGE
jgi:hypothetical protein